ncbi:hypothetical protein D3C78_1411970 [compost metagenome]
MMYGTISPINPVSHSLHEKALKTIRLYHTIGNMNKKGKYNNEPRAIIKPISNTLFKVYGVRYNENILSRIHSRKKLQNTIGENVRKGVNILHNTANISSGKKLVLLKKLCRVIMRPKITA